MPLGGSGRIDVAPYDMNDGFDPGSMIIDRVPGLDTPAALKKTKAVPQNDIGKYRAKNAPIAVIDAKTGKRQPIWVELDSTSPAVDTTTLLIHPAKLLPEGRRYIVVLRNLKDATGKTLKAPKWFELLRDGKQLPRLRSRRRRVTSRSSSPSKNAGIEQKSLYQAWDFTVASSKEPHRPDVSMRDNAFRQLGDTNLKDGTPQGRAPHFSVDTTVDPACRRDRQGDRGNFQVPCYLTTPSCAQGGAFNYGRRRRLPDAEAAVGEHGDGALRLHHPDSARASDPARAMIYGHGLFGDDGEATDGTGGNQAALAADHNFMSCGTEWWGLAGDTAGSPGRRRHSLRRDRPAQPQPVPHGRRPAPAGLPEHPVPRPPDAQPEGLRDRPGVPGRKLPPAVRHRATRTTTATPRAGSWAAASRPSRPT